MTDREKVIQDYINGYNQFDIDKMVAHFDEAIIFENIENGEVNLTLSGVKAFKKQAALATTYFTERTQTIQSFKHVDNSTEIAITYRAVLGMDFPNGLKKGQEIHLSGRSVFVFKGDSIIRLTDIS